MENDRLLFRFDASMIEMLRPNESLLYYWQNQLIQPYILKLSRGLSHTMSLWLIRFQLLVYQILPLFTTYRVRVSSSHIWFYAIVDTASAVRNIHSSWSTTSSICSVKHSSMYTPAKHRSADWLNQCHTAGHTNTAADCGCFMCLGCAVFVSFGAYWSRGSVPCSTWPAIGQAWDQSKATLNLVLRHSVQNLCTGNNAFPNIVVAAIRHSFDTCSQVTPAPWVFVCQCVWLD